METGFVFRCQPCPFPNGAEPERSQFSGFYSVCHYTLLKKNDQIVRGNTYGERGVLGGQSRHCICRNASRTRAVCQRQLSFCYINGQRMAESG